MMVRLDDFFVLKRLLLGQNLLKAKQARAVLVLTLDVLTKPQKEILATKTQLCLPPPRPMINPFKGGNTNRCCDYHQEKGHYTNDCIQLKRQLEIALESGKLNHLVKDIRQKGKGNQRSEAPQAARIIDMIRTISVKEKKRKARGVTEVWMNPLITFPPVSAEDVSDKPIIVEAEIEGYLVSPKRSKPLRRIELEDEIKSTTGHTLHHPLNDEVPNAERNSHLGYPMGHHLGMQKVGK
nr:reverse transcriptase domain-containing protein [Tanacetum cinerariifolium]